MLLMLIGVFKASLLDPSIALIKDINYLILLLILDGNNTVVSNSLNKAVFYCMSCRAALGPAPFTSN